MYESVTIAYKIFYVIIKDVYWKHIDKKCECLQIKMICLFFWNRVCNIVPQTCIAPKIYTNAKQNVTRHF